MINLYQELQAALAANGKTEADIHWVGNHDFTIPTQAFLDAIKEVYYDQETGVGEVAMDLLIIGENWGLRRRILVDGQEGFEFIVMPDKPTLERTDVTKYSIRECLDAEGFRIFAETHTLEEMNPTE